MQRTKSFRRDQLRQLRDERGWSQSKLARKISAHVTSISDWERGANEPSGRHVASLAATFEVEASRFYNENGSSDDEEDAQVSAEDLFETLLVLTRARKAARIA